MNRRVVFVAAAGLGVAAVLIWMIQRRATLPRVPEWLDTRQPPATLAAQLSTLSEAQSWAANRCRPINAACPGYTAGYRVHRLWPDNLSSDPGSLVRFGFEFAGGFNGAN